jgi:hypothetical protein
MKEIKRRDIKVPGSVDKDNIQKYKDNFLQASSGTGRFLVVQDSPSNKLKESNSPTRTLEIMNSVNFGSLLTTLGRVSRFAPYYPKLSYIVDLNPTITTTKGSFELLPVELDNISSLGNNGIFINGVNINVNLSLINEGPKLTQVQNVIAAAHSRGYVTFLKFNSAMDTIEDILDVATMLGVDVTIFAPRVNFDPEITHISGYNSAFLVSDEGQLQIQSIFRSIDQLKKASGNGAFLSEVLNNLQLSEAIKFLNSCYGILYEGKDAEDAYDYFIA